jgi:hypothetical protein
MRVFGLNDVCVYITLEMKPNFIHRKMNLGVNYNVMNISEKPVTKESLETGYPAEDTSLTVMLPTC